MSVSVGSTDYRETVRSILKGLGLSTDNFTQNITGQVILTSGSNTKYTDKSDLVIGLSNKNNFLSGGGGDVLVGGKGKNTYTFHLGDIGTSISKIIDSGSHIGDKIIADGKSLLSSIVPWRGLVGGNVFKKFGEATWSKICNFGTGVYNQVINFTYDQGQAYLRLDLPNNATIEVKDFQPGDYGINLIDIPVTPETYNIISLDAADPEHTDHRDNTYQNLATLADDEITGGAGNDLVINGGTAGGTDWLKGAAGNDLVQSFTNNNAILEGNDGVDALIGTGGSDRIYGGDYGEMEQLIAAGETAININATGDLAQGGTGDDFIYGGNTKDGIFGGAGNDLLVGAGGNDVIYGDGDSFIIPDYGQSTEYWNWSYTIQGDTQNQYEVQFSNIGFVTGTYTGGDDVIYAGTGNDYVDGGADNDTIFGSAGNDIIDGGTREAGADIQYKKAENNIFSKMPGLVRGNIISDNRLAA